MKLKVTVAVALAVTLMTGSAVAAPLFKESPKGRSPLGPKPSDIVVGTFLGGDDRDDFIVSLRGANRVVIYEGKRGGFVRQSSAATAPGPTALAISEGVWSRDLLAVANTGADSVQLFIDRYDRHTSDSMHLEPVNRLSVGGAPADVALGEFVSSGVNNRDPDLLVATPGTDRVSAFTGRAETYSEEASFDIGGNPISMGIDPDYGRPFSFLSQGAQTLTIAEGWANGGLTDPQTLSVGRGPTSVVAGDFVPGDYRAREFVVANTAGSDVSVIDRSESSDPYAVTGSFYAGPGPSALAAAEIDGKRGLDLAVVPRDGNAVRVLLNDGRGRFTTGGIFGTGRNPVAVVPIRANRFFSPDLAVLNARSGDMTLLLRHPDGECRGRPAWIRNGTDADDVIDGTSDPDTIDAGAGDDEVTSRKGWDCVYGGAGNDRIDTFGDEDFVEAGPGNDVVTSGGRSDVIYGGPGRDRLLGEESVNPHGGSWSGNDRLYGGPGPDILNPEWDNDRVWGGRGDDRLHLNDNDVDIGYCGPGNDVAVADPKDKLFDCERIARP